MRLICTWRSSRRALWLVLLGVLVALVSGPLEAQDWKQDDFRWMHGANYVASYAATDVEMWLRYDHAVIDRELGYARKLGLNCVRVFLQSLVYHHEPKAFLTRFEDFLATADKHGLKVMPILFDSCFGVAPSLESRQIWVANPGPDRMGNEWWPEADAYATAVVSAHVGDKRIALWDVMNEPTATHLAGTPEGKESRHYADQSHLFSEGRMRPAWHTWSQLRDHIESVKVFAYEPRETNP